MKEYDFKFTKKWFDGNIPYIGDILIKEYSSRPINILEIGAYECYSTMWFLDNVAKHPDSRITTIEANAQPNLYHNVGLLDQDDRKKLAVHQGLSKDILPILGGEYDLIYIDGSHFPDDIMTDGVLAFNKLKVGGHIIFDDFHIHRVKGFDYLSDKEKQHYSELYGKKQLREKLGSLAGMYPSLTDPVFNTVTPHEVIQFFYTIYGSVLEPIDLKTHLCMMYKRIGTSTMDILGVKP